MPSAIHNTYDSANRKSHETDAGKQPYDMTYHFLLTTYSIDSAFITDGDCATVTGTLVSLPTPVSVVTATEFSSSKSETVQSTRQSHNPY